MPKRLLDCCASDFRSFTKSDLLESIQKSEGRVIACETIGTVQPLLGNVTNAEFAASMGADILLLNMFDVQHPVINGLPETEPENTVRMLKKLTGRPIGTSQEGADTDTIRRIALMCKMAGTDIHHIGDTGYTGMALAENIMAYSIAVRGIRHTYHRMAISVER